MECIKLLFSALLLLLLASCGSANREREKKAEEMGKRDAVEFVMLHANRPKDELKLHGFLLDVRQKQKKLSDAGFPKVAEKYEHSFRITLMEKDSVLYNTVFK